jgi:hypothetical protein
MKGLIKVGVIALLIFTFGLIITSGDAWATSQWAKKYGIACTECHTLFPRLSYMGEKFMRDGYQFNQDGNDNKQQINSRLVLDELKHLFGIRLNLTAVEYITNGVDENAINKKSHLNFGETNWVQFFVAGSIYKNVSIFIETELQNSDAHFKWYKLGFHNLFGPQGAANLVIGQQAPMEWMPASGRLRVFPNSESLAWLPSTDGEDDVQLANDHPAISFYGTQRSITYFAGVAPKQSDEGDDNNKVSYWTGGRWDVTDGEFEGSAIGLFGMWGTDVSDTAEVSGFQRDNDFTRYSIQALLRSGPFEFLAAYSFGEEDNPFYLTEAQLAMPAFNDYDDIGADSIFLQAAYQFGADKEYYSAIRWWIYDVDEDYLQTASTGDQEKLAFELFYTPMENLKIGWVSELDLEDRGPETNAGILYPLSAHKGDDRSNTHQVIIRTMF